MKKSIGKLENIEFHHSLMVDDNYDPLVALGFNPELAVTIPNSEAVNFLDTEGSSMPLKSFEDFGLEFGSFSNKRALWNDEFRVRGLEILRKAYSEDEIAEFIPFSFTDAQRKEAEEVIMGEITGENVDVVEELVDSLNSLARNHLEELVMEKHPQKREELDSEPVFNPDSDTGFSVIDGASVETMST